MIFCCHQNATRTNADLISIEQYETIVSIHGYTFMNNVSQMGTFLIVGHFTSKD